MALRDILITMVILGGVLSGSLIFTGQLLEAFQVNTADSDLQKLDSLQDEISNTSLQKTEQAEASTSDVGSAIEENVFFLKPVWQGIKTTYQMIPFIGSVAGRFGAILGLPTWFINTISTIITIIILFLIYSVFQ